jgi:hypothetical protein
MFEIAGGVVLGLLAFVFLCRLNAGLSEWVGDKAWWKKNDREMLEVARAAGFKSWAEYMVVHGYGKEVRKSWEKKAAQEQAKRARWSWSTGSKP